MYVVLSFSILTLLLKGISLDDKKQNEPTSRKNHENGHKH